MIWQIKLQIELAKSTQKHYRKTVIMRVGITSKYTLTLYD